MGGLYHTLNIGAESLYASRQGVDTTGHNIANAQTEGYSRQRVNLEQRDPSETRGVIIGNGVFVKNINRAHDQFLERQINDNNQNNGRNSARFDSMKPLESIYSPELNSTLVNEIDSFFNSFQDLSNFPEELTVRTGVRENAQNLINSFHRLDSSLKNQRFDINERIRVEAGNASQKLQEIAKLNVAIKVAETAANPEVSDLLDQQDKVLRELTHMLDVNYYRGSDGSVVVRGPQETLLVERGSFASVGVLAGQDESSGIYKIIVEGGAVNDPVEITDTNKRGTLGGFVNVRDKVIPKLLEHNNKMAFTFAESVNRVHQNGYGLNEYKEKTGRLFFALSSDMNNAAESISLDAQISQSTDAIAAASSPNAPGDNVIVNELLRLKEQRLMDGGLATIQDYYSGYIGVFGLDLVRADHVKQADEKLAENLASRREAVAGVSMDEEAVNLLKWQANFTASSKVITTIDEMLDTVLQMKR